MSSKAWFPFYVGDYLADTQMFTTEQHGAYILLLAHYWTNQGPITSNPRDLQIIMGLSKYNFSKNSPAILKKFTEKNEKFYHSRMDREIAKAVEISTVKAKSGKRGGLAKAQASAKQKPTQSQSQPHIVTTTRGTRLPDDWKPEPELLQWAASERPDLDLKKSTDSFCDYWHSKAGAAARRVKWDLTFKNWIRNERTNRKTSNATRKQPLSERHADARRSAVKDYQDFVEAEGAGVEVVGSNG